MRNPRGRAAEEEGGGGRKPCAKTDAVSDNVVDAVSDAVPNDAVPDADPAIECSSEPCVVPDVFSDTAETECTVEVMRNQLENGQRNVHTLRARIVETRILSSGAVRVKLADGTATAWVTLAPRAKNVFEQSKKDCEYLAKIRLHVRDGQPMPRCEEIVVCCPSR